jgi:hypothetical protein
MELVVPNTGPRPASSTPSTTSLDMSSAICFGIGEKCEYDFPVRMSDLEIEGAMKTSESGVACSISSVSIWTSSCDSAMFPLKLIVVWSGASCFDVVSGGLGKTRQRVLGGFYAIHRAASASDVNGTAARQERGKTSTHTSCIHGTA